MRALLQPGTCQGCPRESISRTLAHCQGSPLPEGGIVWGPGPNLLDFCDINRNKYFINIILNYQHLILPCCLLQKRQ